MKKILIFLVILVILVAAGIFFLQQQTGISILPTAKFEIESVLPENPVIYFEIQDVRKNLERLSATPLWKALGKVDWEMVMAGQRGNKEGLMVLKAMEMAVENPEQMEVLSKFLGQDISLAVYPFEIDVTALRRGDPKLLQEISQRIGESLYLVTRLDKEAQVAELLAGSREQFGNSVSIDEIIYKDQTIKLASITGTGIEVAFIRLKDLLIVSLDKFAIQRSIDVYQEAAASLKDDGNYGLTSGTYIPEADFKAYFNSHFLIKTFADTLIKMAEQEGANAVAVKQQVDQTFQAIQGFRSLGVSGLWTDLWQTKLDLHFNLDEMDPSVARYYRNCVNTANRSIDFIPAETLIYQWSHCFDLNYYWDELKAELERSAVPGQPAPSQQIAQYEQMIGLSVEGDVLPAFGKEIGGYIKTIHMDQKFPIPEIVLFLKINDRVKADKIMNLIRNQPLAVFQSETHKEVPVSFISLPIAENVSPGYAFVGDYLLIAINKEMLFSSIDVSRNEAKGLPENTAFAAVNKGLTTDNTGLMYVEVDELAFKLSSIIEWSNEWASANDRKKEAFKKGAEMRLTQVQESIEEDEKALSITQAELVELRRRVQDMRDSGQELGMLEKSLARLEEKEAGIRGEIEANIDEALEIQQTIKGYSKQTMPEQERAKYLNGIIYPLVNCLKTIDGLGLVTTMSETAMETRIFLNL